MKTFAVALLATLSLSAPPASAGAPVARNDLFTLAQADVTDATVDLDALSIADRERDREREQRDDRIRQRLGEDRDYDRHCRTVTVEDVGRTRTTRQCD